MGDCITDSPEMLEGVVDPTAQSLRHGLRRGTSLYTREALRAQNLKEPDKPGFDRRKKDSGRYNGRGYLIRVDGEFACRGIPVNFTVEIYRKICYNDFICESIPIFEECMDMAEKFRRGPRPERRERQPIEEIEGQLEGRNALTEALRSGRTIDKVFIANGDTDKGLQRLAAQAKEAGAVIVPVDRRKLDAMSTTHAHQGVIALAAAREYFSIDDILEEAATRGENALIVICDELSDPHNLGAIIRTAECAGAHGVIIPKRRSVGLTATVAKASAGAVEYMKVARVTNINAAMDELKEKGVWIFGTAAEGSVPMYQADLTGPTAIVIGSEGDGMSRLVQKNCDVTVHIPMKGRISSLNASSAASILLYEAVRQRR